jgi:hypothetical protein
MAQAAVVTDLRRSDSDELRALHAKLDAILEGQVEILERVGAARGPRDQADERLLLAIHEAAEGLPFKASHVIKRARHVPALAAALLAADITSQEQLGKLLGRLEGVTIAGLRLERTKDRRAPWRIVLRT